MAHDARPARSAWCLLELSRRVADSAVAPVAYAMPAVVADAIARDALEVAPIANFAMRPNHSLAVTLLAVAQRRLHHVAGVPVSHHWSPTLRRDLAAGDSDRESAEHLQFTARGFAIGFMLDVDFKPVLVASARHIVQTAAPGMFRQRAWRRRTPKHRPGFA